MNAPVPRLPLAAVDHQIGRLISRLLAKSPDDRPRSAVEVVFEIDRHLAMVAPPPPGPRNTLRLAVATATGLALTLTSIGAWYRWRRAPRADTALGVAPPVLGSIVRPPADAALPIDAQSVGTASTIVVDAPPAPTVVITRARVKRPVDTSEVTVDLGSGGDTADVNTTVSP